MFIKELIISSADGIIRDIEFKSGLNLIIDDTPIDDTKSTGNNVEKTIVLKLIDFCLGAKANQNNLRNCISFSWWIEKIKYISQHLPELLNKLNESHKELVLLLKQEKDLTDKIAKGDSFEELEKIKFEIKEKYRIKGEYENIISQIDEAEKNINTINTQIDTIDNYLNSGDFENSLRKQVKKFNKVFSSISQELYDEKYAFTYEWITNKRGQQFYKLNAFNANLSSGKMQGEILSFDLAYLLFADEENIPCLHFLLNDKKELMHDNQLIKVAEFVQNWNIQLAVSILKDKLPSAILDKAHIAVELSQKSKLFKIESN